MSALKLPLASLRLAVAIRYWHGARIILANQVRPVEFMEPVGHLLSMCAELCLKAYLLEHGLTERELGSHKIGHDLYAVLKNCIERGLQLSELDVRHILAMRPSHFAHFLRYGPRTLDGGVYAIALFDEEEALVAIARVLDVVAGDFTSLRHLHERPIDLDWPCAEPTAHPVTMDQFRALAAAANENANRVAGFGAARGPR